LGIKEGYTVQDFSVDIPEHRVTTLESKHTVLQTCFERKEDWAEGRNFIGQYCETISDFWKHIFLICMFEKESGLVTAYY